MYSIYNCNLGWIREEWETGPEISGDSNQREERAGGEKEKGGGTNGEGERKKENGRRGCSY